MSRLQPPPFERPVSNTDPVWKRFILRLHGLADSGLAPADALYITAKASSELTQERNLGSLASGYLKIVVALGIAAPLTVAAIPTSDLSGLVAIANGGTNSAGAPTAGGIAYGTGVAYAVTAAGAAGEILVSAGAATPAWASVAAATAHPLLDGSIDNDTIANGVTRGALIVGNSTPKWASLAIGVTGRVLRSDGTDPTWAQVDLTTDVTGILPIVNGGTGLGVWTAQALVYGGAGGTSLAQTSTLVWSGTGLGVGTATISTGAIADFQKSGAQAIVYIKTFFNGAGGSVFQGVHARGTQAAPLRTLSGDVLGGMNGGGYYAATDVDPGTETGSIARFRFVTKEALTVASQGTKLEIATTAIGAIAVATRMTVDDISCALTMPLGLKGYTVATLPAGVVGHLAYATDLLAPAFLTAAAGGGAVTGPVFYNGAAWVCV